MVTHLFKNFLVNKKIYQKNIDFWKTIIYTLLSAENLSFHNYLATKKKDGSLYMDGNPIYNFKIDNSNRAVKIIQEEIETDDVEFSAWVSTVEIEGQKIEELVISLELSNESTLLAIEIINAWIINKFSKQKTEKFIDKIFNLSKTIFKQDNSKQKQIEYI